MTAYFAGQLSDKLGTRVSIGRVDIAFFNKLVLDDLFVEDYRNDTLAYIGEMKAAINYFSIKKKRIDFGTISLDRLYFYIYQDEDTSNLDVFVYGLVPDETDTVASSTPWELNFSKLVVENSRFRFRQHDYLPQDFGINYLDMHADKLNFTATDIVLGDSLKFKISNLNCIEKGGAHIEEFTTLLSMSKHHANFDELTLRLSNSEIRASTLAFRFDSLGVLRDFTNKVKIDGDFYETGFSFADLAFFAPALKGFKEKVHFSGQLKGTISDIRAKDFSLNFGNFTRIKASMSLIGLPSIKQTFLYADFQELRTSKSDIENLKLPPEWSDGPIVLPDQLKEAGLITYRGNFTGFTNDFVAYGTLSSQLGTISTDLGLKQTGQNGYSYRGAIKTIDFNLGKFVGPEARIGKVDLEIQVTGTIDSMNRVSAEPKGIVQKIEFNNYQYKNVKLNGKLNGKKFNGFVYILEPNLELDFTGAVDFTNDVPVFDFNAVVMYAKLDNLNLYKEDSLPVLSFILESNFVGDNFDEFKGQINLWDLSYTNSERKVTIDQLSLVANPEDTVNSLQLISSLADISIWGKYTFAGLTESLPGYFYHFYPSFLQKKQVNQSSTDSLYFNIQINDTDSLMRIFFPGYAIGKGSVLNGYFDAGSNVLDLDGSLKDVKIQSLSFENLTVSTQTGENDLVVFLSSNSVLRNEVPFLQKLELSSKYMRDSLFAQINWYHIDSLVYEGNMATAASFARSDSGRIPQINIELLPSTITIADSLWQIAKAHFVVDSSLLQVSDFLMSREGQLLSISGSVSKSKEDTLYMEMNNIPLSNFNILTGPHGFDLHGTLNGNASLTDVYNNPIFFSNLKINQLEINGKKLGDGIIKSEWDNNNEGLKITFYTQRDQVRPFYVDGSYFPRGGKLDFEIILDKLYLSIFEPYLEENISELGGIVSDKLTLTGTIEKPVLEGRLKVQKVGFVFDYLNTRYNFTDFVDFKKNKIEFSNIEVYDTRGEKAIVSGSLNHNYFSDFTLDITLDATNFTLLDTREEDNSLYFGQAYGTGDVHITGSFELANIDINMKTEKGTRFFIPLTSGSEISESSFITFVNNVPDAAKSELEEEIAKLKGVSLKMDLEVTPDAEVQLIFESKMGDIIKGNGNANLKLEISTTGDFGMYGDYEIVQGEYLLTLGNLLSKRFLVKPGGTIGWNGDPYNAIIDLETYYELNASLQDLYLDSSEVYRKRVPVECQIKMSGALMNPNIVFGIDLPKSSEADRAQLRNLPDDELNKQFISLLFINRFQPLPGLDFANSGNISSGYSLTESTSELLSNQLSHWLSQISNDFDIGFTYRPGNELSSDEVEVALKTQFFNEKLTVNGNVGMGGQYENTNSIVGDVEADLKLNESGKFRVKAFRRSNTNFDYEKGPTTQGAGIFYREEFDSFEELILKWLKIERKEP